jgi:HSP20 family molecular chaperone IbpA
MAVTRELERKKEKRTFTPDVDIIERGEDILLVADLPGVEEGSVEVTIEKDRLAIHGRVEADGENEQRPWRSEYAVGDYRKVFTLSDMIDREHIEASVKNGTLRLMLPKADDAKPRKIAIKG